MKRFTLAVAAIALAVPAFAQNAATAPRFAVFNVQKVVSESNAGKAAYETLKKMQDEKTGRLQKMDQEIKSLEQEFTTKRLSLSEEKLAEMQKQIAERRINLQRAAQDADRELGEARDKSLAELERRLGPVINAIGKEMGFAAIFNRFDSGIVYASDAIDITDVVVKRFNEATK